MSQPPAACCKPAQGERDYAPAMWQMTTLPSHWHKVTEPPSGSGLSQCGKQSKSCTNPSKVGAQDSKALILQPIPKILHPLTFKGFHPISYPTSPGASSGSSPGTFYDGQEGPMVSSLVVGLDTCEVWPPHVGGPGPLKGPQKFLLEFGLGLS